MDQQPPAEVTVSAHRDPSGSFNYSDRAAFADADRGHLGSLVPGVVRSSDGRVVWESDSYGFLTGEAPPSVNPSLWRQSQLVAKQALYVRRRSGPRASGSSGRRAGAEHVHW
jgi:alkyl sulfatase BDS1-like metallo-beta-lactamase superfamily hydrolase